MNESKAKLTDRDHETLKLLFWPVLIVAAVALYCYARVDLGMSLEQVNTRIESWAHSIFGLVVMVLVVILTPVVANPFIRLAFERKAKK